MKLPQWVPGIGVWVVIGAVYVAAAFGLGVTTYSVVMASVVALLPAFVVLWLLTFAVAKLPGRWQTPALVVGTLGSYVAIVCAIALAFPDGPPSASEGESAELR